MKTTIPLHVDAADLARLKDYVPDLSELEVPKLEHVGRAADDTIDRLLGRSRTTVWPWVATSLGLVLLVGVIAAAFMWMRRWSTEPEPEMTPAPQTSPTAYMDLDASPVAEAV